MSLPSHFIVPWEDKDLEEKLTSKTPLHQHAGPRGQLQMPTDSSAIDLQAT